MALDEKTTEFMPLKVYARRKGWTYQNVQDKIRRGIISKASTRPDEKWGVMVDVARADLDIEFFGDDLRTLGNDIAALERAPAKASIKPSVLIEGEMSREPVEPGTTLDKMRGKASEYRDAKIDTEELKARKLRLEIGERERTLLPADEVRKLLIQIVGETKDALLNIPGRIAHVLHGMKDPLEVEAKLYAELNETLGNLSRLEKL